jgi:hypothetical protein
MKANTVQVPCGSGTTTQNVDDLFVSIDLAQNVAYVVNDCQASLHWQEIPRRDAELLVAMGAHSVVTIGSDPIKGEPLTITPSQSGVDSPQKSAGEETGWRVSRGL